MQPPEESKAHLRGDAAVFDIDAMSDAIGEPLNCDVVVPGAGMRSPEMKRKSLMPGATGERNASLLRAGFSPEVTDAGDVQDLHTLCQCLCPNPTST
jgi:hypothetical protein